MWDKIARFICLVFGHDVEEHIKLGPSGDLIRFYVCPRCGATLSNQDSAWDR